jgi:hypothetical protein
MNSVLLRVIVKWICRTLFPKTAEKMRLRDARAREREHEPLHLPRHQSRSMKRSRKLYGQLFEAAALNFRDPNLGQLAACIFRTTMEDHKADWDLVNSKVRRNDVKAESDRIEAYNRILAEVVGKMVTRNLASAPPPLRYG